MAIQHRRGVFHKFDPSKLLPGEWAVVLSGDTQSPDGKAVYICFAAGDVKRMSTVEEITAYVDDITQDTYEEIMAELQPTVTAAQSAAAQALDAKNQASQAATTANTAASTANDAAERAEDAIEAMGDISELAVPLMSDTTRGGATLGSGLRVDDGALSLGDLVQSGSGAEVATDGCAIFSVEGEGWSEQETTTGKNLLPCNGQDLGASGSITVSGVTLTRNADGSVTLNGTATANNGVRIGRVTLSEGTYVIGSSPSGATNSTYFFNIATEAGGFDANILTAPYSLSVNAEKVYIMRIYFRSGQVLSNLTFYPQLEAGSTATSYEPYTGGAPSPSPDYPQEIEVARGRNLLPNNASGKTQGGVTYKVNSDGSVSLSGVASSNSVLRLWLASENDLSSVVGKTVTLSGGLSSQIRLVFNDGVNSFMSQGSPITFVMPPIADTGTEGSSSRIYIYVYSGANCNGVTIYPQLELGSTPTPYVPYGHVGLEVQSRNLIGDCEYYDTPRTAAGLNVEYVGDGWWHISGTVTGTTAGVISFYGYETDESKYPIRNPGTYTVSVETRGNLPLAGNGLRGQFMTEANPYYLTSTAQSVTVDAECIKYVRIYRSAAATGKVYDGYIRFMLEEGSTAHAWQPYSHTTIPIPLPSKGFAASLPDGTADALSINSAGRWEWADATAITTYDGSNMDGWIVQGSYASSGGGFYGKVFISGDTRLASVCLVSNLQYIGNMVIANDYSGKIGFGQTLGIFRIRPEETSEAQTIEKLATWFTAHPMTVLYPLATPTTEHGYIDLPALPSGATVSIPELESIGCAWFVDGCEPIVEHAANMARRETEENESIEDALAELAARVAALES